MRSSQCIGSSSAGWRTLNVLDLERAEFVRVSHAAIVQADASHSVALKFAGLDRPYVSLLVGLPKMFCARTAFGVVQEIQH